MQLNNVTVCESFYSLFYNLQTDLHFLHKFIILVLSLHSHLRTFSRCRSYSLIRAVTKKFASTSISSSLLSLVIPCPSMQWTFQVRLFFPLLRVNYYLLLIDCVTECQDSVDDLMCAKKLICIL